ncbi:HlyD family efflux transporter periplasmic adaptor subunit [Streptomyces uncialis]|uniref:HlyD family efflux transporter periplasmic adaptor subunit n=1 Tax=Streptomyces uncialis TaxID=1048205 RepID=UPI00386EF046|nr:HlyD family efflux transporter periplasmic adaptor subunit [Streptomyces uncialis]
MQFRQRALAKARSPEELDLPVRLARPQGRLALAVCALVLAASGGWAVTGGVPSELSAPGVLTHGHGGHVLQSPVAGQVTAVVAAEGERLAAGAPVLRVRTADGDRAVRAVAAGRITSLAVSIGAVVTAGAEVALVERVGRDGEPLIALLYVPADRAAAVTVGARVEVTVESVPARRYGKLGGVVREVGRTPQSARRIGAFLGDARLGAEFTRRGLPVTVEVRLDRDPATRSGYRWSAPPGPPYPPGSMTRASGAVRLPAQRPIDWLLP